MLTSTFILCWISCLELIWDTLVYFYYYLDNFLRGSTEKYLHEACEIWINFQVINIDGWSERKNVQTGTLHPWRWKASEKNVNFMMKIEANRATIKRLKSGGGSDVCSLLCWWNKVFPIKFFHHQCHVMKHHQCSIFYKKLFIIFFISVLNKSISIFCR